MSDTNSFTLKSRRIVEGAGTNPFEGVIEVRDGKVAEVRRGKAQSGPELLDVGNLVVMPGLVDTHAHINEPGRTEWEGFDTATRAAASGGITTVIDMPLNSIPPTTTLANLASKAAAASGHCFIDYGFWGGLVPDNISQISSLAQAGVMGFKCFLIDSGVDEFPRVDENVLKAAIPLIAATGLPLIVHAELDLGGSDAKGDPRSYQTYLKSRPRSWENDAIRLMIDLCRKTGCRVHIVHLSSADALSDIERARADGLSITAETCPHYLLLASETIGDGCTQFKCAPPIRENENRERLWKGLARGSIDFVVSDHSPCTPALKLPEKGDFLEAWGGISSLQFGLPLVWTEARQRGHRISDLVRWMSAGPAELVGLGARKGAIVAGFDADLVVWNPEASFTVEPGMVRHRHPLTPYASRPLTGVVEMTFLRGRKIFEAGRFPTGPGGKQLGSR